jgi:type IV pilus assembly protein PilM
MAHTIVGLDIGAHSVKILRVVSGVRGYDIELYDEEPVRPELAEVDPSDGDGNEAAERPPESTQDLRALGVLPAGAEEALEALVARGALEADQIIVGYDLFACLQTDINLPFVRRRDILQALPMQIEDSYPVDIDDLTVDFQVSDVTNEDGDHRVTVVATPSDDLRSFLHVLEQVGVEPRIIDIDPANLLGAYRMLRTAPTGPVAIVDIGLAYTDICIVDNEEIVVMRRLRIGGRTFTERLAEMMRIDTESAEQVKLSDAYVELPSALGAAPEQASVHTVCRDVAGELSSELSRTLHAHAAKAAGPVESVMLCGGGGLLRGLARFLATALGIPVDVLVVEEAEAIAPGAGARAVGCLGLAARGLGRKPASRFNLRQGEFVYRGSLAFLKAPARALAIFALLLCVVLGFNLWAERWAVKKQRDAYQFALSSLTESVLGEPIDNARDVIQLMARVPEGEGSMPEVTAYELFRDISQRLVELREDLDIVVTVDRLSVEIAPRNQISIRGSTDSAESIDEIETELETLPCVGEIARERETRNRTTNLLEFELRADNICPRGDG